MRQSLFRGGARAQTPCCHTQCYALYCSVTPSLVTIMLRHIAPSHSLSGPHAAQPATQLSAPSVLPASPSHICTHAPCSHQFAPPPVLLPGRRCGPAVPHLAPGIACPRAPPALTTATRFTTFFTVHDLLNLVHTHPCVLLSSVNSPYFRRAKQYLCSATSTRPGCQNPCKNIPTHVETKTKLFQPSIFSPDWCCHITSQEQQSEQ